MKKAVALGVALLMLVTVVPFFASGTPITSASASSVTGTLTADKAIDGNNATIYSSEGHAGPLFTEWLQVDLGSKQYSLDAVRLDPRPKGYGFPVDFKLQYSDNGTTWNDIPGANFTNFSNPGNKEVVLPFTKRVNARYIRLYATKLGHDDFNTYYLQMEEMKVEQKYVATASSQIGTFVAGNAVDGNTDVNAGTTAFYSSNGSSTAAVTEWLQLDLGQTTNGINLVRLHPRQSGMGFPADFKIQYSNSPGGPWTDAPGTSFSGFNASSGQQVVIPFSSPVNARYVRLYATKLGSDGAGSYYLQIVEMSVESGMGDALTPASNTATSSISGWGPERLSDYDANTVWSSDRQPAASSTQSFTLTYSVKTPINKLVLTPRPGGLAFPVDFTIKYSENGTTFTTIPGQSYTNYANPGSTQQTFEFEPVQAKAIRVEATKLGTDDFGFYYFQMGNATAYKWDTHSDTWAAVDNLGRTLPAYSNFNETRSDKFVGMFYFLWLGQHGTTGPHDVTDILASNPGAMSNAGNPPWGPYNAFHHWGESLFGYYLSQDNYVIRKHAQMLSDAGVDTIVFDVTNGFTYKDQYMELLQEYADIRSKGGKTPQIVFLCPFGDPTSVVTSLYNDLYGAGLYSDLWFRWDNGKPLIMADPAYFSGNPAINNFFTFRKPQPNYFTGPTAANQWGWLEVYPQHTFYSSSVAKEQVTVGIAQNAVPNGSGGWKIGSMSQPGVQGRSFSDGVVPAAPATEYGYNFMEQWGRALEIDPKFVFVTGWNEWVAMRFTSFADYSATNVFVDAFNEENSRDIEPMKGGYGDSYYYQLVDYIRRYKGVSKPQNADNPKTIAIDGSFADWKDIKQEFRDDVGDPASRNETGWGTAGTYTNTTGRNDLQTMKVARDANNIYFYVKTKNNMTSYTDANWMRLFIKTSDAEANWQGYNYVVNRTGAGASTTLLEKVSSAGGWDWTTVSSSIYYSANGQEMEIAIPRTSLGLSDLNKPMRLEFKWHDNMQTQGDVYEFTTNGDAAPNGRFNYVFTEVTH
ncbi:discoidin domain-containing protein [Paenibacillus mendelii]|uniref:Discoidin domain-containing protein n=1 Tax=Paenibacillus mendelii TaxID=206163 RepID=A0ABV6JC51_9BACL|nr:discoidin domain-containing protein [Paenibacillus mendelii]MCQ6562743.1 discoidin domain-containing protein [Paenibacillus mendelii]